MSPMCGLCWYPTPPLTHHTHLPQPPRPGRYGSPPCTTAYPLQSRNKVLYRFFSPMVPRALMRGERKTVEKAETQVGLCCPCFKGPMNQFTWKVRQRPSNGTAYLAGEVAAPPIGGQVSARVRAGGQGGQSALPAIPEQPSRGRQKPPALNHRQRPLPIRTNSLAFSFDYSRPSLTNLLTSNSSSD